MPWTGTQRDLRGIVGRSAANFPSSANLPTKDGTIHHTVGRPDWPELQDKVVRTQKLQVGPTAPVVQCAVRTMRPDKEEAFRKVLISQLSPEEQMWLQPQPEDVTDITTLVRMPFAAPLWEDAIPLVILTVVDPAVTAASEVPTSKGGLTKRMAGAGGELGSAASMASTTAVMTTAMTTMAATGLTAMTAAVRQPLQSRLAGLASSIMGVVGAGGRKSGSGAHLAAQPGALVWGLWAVLPCFQLRGVKCLKRGEHYPLSLHQQYLVQVRAPVTSGWNRSFWP